jgi:hypothetical protein
VGVRAPTMSGGDVRGGEGGVHAMQHSGCQAGECSTSPTDELPRPVKPQCVRRNSLVVVLDEDA